jgi:hypothetical protein
MIIAIFRSPGLPVYGMIVVVWTLGLPSGRIEGMMLWWSWEEKKHGGPPWKSESILDV